MADKDSAAISEVDTGDIEPTPLDSEPSYDPRTDTYTTAFDADRTDAGYALVEALAKVRCCDVKELPPLSDSLDPDALTMLIGEADAPISVDVIIDGFRATIRSDGRIEIEPPN
ncbi:HalOD1 output domain-containing protein [Haloarcula marina]|uniref:HalOD1 output domain-containing protein n=1 Tax=Haloarcula marina TaxID=2961574 RepID=UPI0020B7D233|nr:HalOD1 output domain-containing protein [Halomicroarcula marina]